jgi:adenosylhomocysteine nucleosidase
MFGTGAAVSLGRGQKAMPRRPGLGSAADFWLSGRVKLHREIRLDRPLVVVALEEEARELHVAELPVLVTGVGKLRAASALAAVLARQRPSRLINLGTAGALRQGLAGPQVVGRVIQHDFDNEAIAAVTGQQFGAPLDLGGSGPVLASGDSFVSGGPLREHLAALADLVDMEGYAVAAVARQFGLDVTVVKVVSDAACDAAGRTWQDSLAECAEQLGAWLRREVADA